MTAPVLELTLRGAEKTVAVACGTCRIVAANRTMAQNCCGPNICGTCGEEECERSWLICRTCQQKKSAAREQKLYDDATKIQVAEYGYDQVCREPYGGEDQYVLVDEWDSEESECNWAWACNPMEWPRLDATDIVRLMLEDNFPEDADDRLDVGALQKLLDGWLERQPPSDCYMADHTRVVVFPEVEEKEDIDFACEDMMKAEEPPADAGSTP